MMACVLVCVGVVVSSESDDVVLNSMSEAKSPLLRKQQLQIIFLSVSTSDILCGESQMVFLLFRKSNIPYWIISSGKHFIVEIKSIEVRKLDLLPMQKKKKLVSICYEDFDHVKFCK